MASTSRPKVNLRSTAVKRIMQEAAELASADVEVDGFVAAPLEDDIFEWHCTMRGVQDSEYDGGLYHLRILLPSSYPMSAPDIMLMTPNGRFELGKKICIDGLTSFHAGSWQPAWGVRTAVVGLRSFWMQNGEALSAIGALDYSKDERRRLAGLSRAWKCPTCGVKNDELLPPCAAKAASPEAAGGSASTTVSEEGVDASTSNGDISLDPAPAEVPTVVPPALFGTVASGTGLAATQPLPIDLAPPALEQGNVTEAGDGQGGPSKHDRDQISVVNHGDTTGTLRRRQPHALTQQQDTSSAVGHDVPLSPTRTSLEPTSITAQSNTANTPTDGPPQVQAQAISPLPRRRRRLAFFTLDALIFTMVLTALLLISSRMDRA